MSSLPLLFRSDVLTVRDLAIAYAVVKENQGSIFCLFASNSFKKLKNPPLTEEFSSEVFFSHFPQKTDFFRRHALR